MKLTIQLMIGAVLIIFGAWAFLGNEGGSDAFGFLFYLLSIGLIYAGGSLLIKGKTTGKKGWGLLFLVGGLALMMNWIPIFFHYLSK
ncbi:hypothetical protein [Lihuaxuella thermophila]|uniref:Uncharacterized protein n=1 Tax=Lihuaxuella thermophila TaxID=1173111 RepID=A0A1H8GRT2_9BACL|nr:hypothetical protein [Lihuaxuella thermophila]SEN45978.1 hypothetical protein SAMN05444955_1125 [Lihuaxuella thermophila]